MAQSTLHFSFGMLVGTALAFPRLRRAYTQAEAWALPVGRWLLLSYGLGAFAMAPSLLRAAGMPDAVVTAWWSNIFLFYGLIESLLSGGIILGELGIAGLCALQYLVILVGIWRARSKLAGRARARPSE